jgi:nicotinamide riboside kinase
LYVLTGDEIPFVQDGLRDGEHLRGWMTQRFREVLATQPTPWVETSGSHEQRLNDVLARVAELATGEAADEVD